MKSLLHRVTSIKIIEGVLLTILGVLIAVIGGLYAEQQGFALAICVAVFLFIDGFMTIFSFLLDPKSNFSFSTVLGCIFITIGILLCIKGNNPAGIANTIAYFVACLLITCGGVYFAKACIQIYSKAPVGWIIINFLIAILGISLGVASIVYLNDFLKIVFIIIGIAVSVLGVVDLIFAIMKYREQHKNDAIKPDLSETKEPKKRKIVKGKVKESKKLKKDNEPKKLENKKIKSLEDKSDNQNDDEKSDDTKDDVVVIENPDK